MPNQQWKRFLRFITTNENSEKNRHYNSIFMKLMELIKAFNVSYTNLPSPETSNEFKNRSSPALNVVIQSPDSKFIKFTYIRLRDKHTKCWASLQYAKYGIFWFITPLRVTCKEIHNELMMEIR